MARCRGPGGGLVTKSPAPSRVAGLAYGLATTSTDALRAPAAGGAFEVAVEGLFLSSSRAVETPGQAGDALPLPRGMPARRSELAARPRKTVVGQFGL